MSKRNDIGRYVRKKIFELQQDSPWAKSMLAKLRRGVGKNISDVPDSWELIFTDIPDELIGNKNVTLSKELKSIFTVLCLFSLHQQGQEQSAYRDDIRFARALGKMVNDDNHDAIKRRFDSAITSNDLDELVNHIRGLIQIMKANSVSSSFDYSALAMDFYDYQFDSAKSRIRLEWGVDFYRVNEDSKEKNNNKELEQKE